jgi:hypothetical protein
MNLHWSNDIFTHVSSLKLPGNVAIWLSALALGCAAAWQVRDVLELPPPAEVRAERRGRQIIISWRAYPSIFFTLRLAAWQERRWNKCRHQWRFRPRRRNTHWQCQTRCRYSFT